MWDWCYWVNNGPFCGQWEVRSWSQVQGLVSWGLASKELASQDGAPGIPLSSDYHITKYICNSEKNLIQVFFLTALLVSSSLAVPFPFASPAKSCNLVRSATKTGAMCFLEPECEQKCSTTYEQQCSTQQEQQCSTVSEQQCATVREQQCNTVNEQQCNTVKEQKCSTGMTLSSYFIIIFLLFSSQWAAV